jgi:FkbM family methyltransferase
MILKYSTADDASKASRDRRFAVSTGDNLMLVSVLGDMFKLYVDARDMSQTPYLAAEGIQDAWLLDAICNMVSPGATVVDVGAGFGYQTLVLCELVGPCGRVFAFEPHPRIYPILKRNIEINGYSRRARPYPNALGAADGDGELALHKWRFNSASLSERAKASFGTLNLAAVHISRMDELLSETRIDPDFYLVSAVGYEPEVWAGMRGLLAAKRKVSMLLDFTHRWYADPVKFSEQILEDGFNVHRIGEFGSPEHLTDPKQFTTQFRSWLRLIRH